MNDNRPPAFDALLLQHEPYIRSRMYSLEKDATKHEDIYQEVIAKALEQWAAYRPTGNFAGWLYWLVRSVVHKRSRSEMDDAQTAYAAALPSTSEPTQEYVADISLALSRMCSHNIEDVEALPVSKKEAMKTGSKYFYTWEPCKSGHLSPKYSSGGACVMCVRLSAEVQYKHRTARAALNDNEPARKAA